MMPELEWMLQGAGTAAAGFVIAMVIYWTYETSQAKTRELGTAIADMQLVDLVLRQNIIDAADDLVNLAYENPSIFVISGPVASALMFYCDEVHVKKTGTDRGTKVFARRGEHTHEVTAVNSTRATIEACAQAINKDRKANE